MELSNDKVKKITRISLGDIVITGTMSSGAAGWICCWGNIAVLKEYYKGSIAPLFNNEHSLAVLDGTRERGYIGRMFKHEGKVYVMDSPQITFYPLKINQVQQLQLF
ncbi:hypothetical protein [Flavobacterium sp. NRK1]|uniref:hypothetical protein n=1 Tax=Flavobacterium sp. NRK1 TaxID=2954929 RepID=UPI0020930E1E|nr:hypothetical protein [Flavobacterium sp. NRK1]MCO6149078.1 hypothetical protein [Flavobacterium sp. NRK1]